MALLFILCVISLAFSLASGVLCLHTLCPIWARLMVASAIVAFILFVAFVITT